MQRGDRGARRRCRDYAPRVTTVKIPVDKIGMVIGPKGQTINAIQDETGAEISIEDDGTIYVGATNGPSAEAAVDRINAIANPTLPKVGDQFLGTVVKTAAFGAFVSLLPGRDGLLHISKVGDGKRVEQVEDFLNVGDKVEVADRRHRRPRQDLPGQGAARGRGGARPRAAGSARPAADRGDRGPRDRGDRDRGDRGPARGDGATAAARVEGGESRAVAATGTADSDDLMRTVEPTRVSRPAPLRDRRRRCTAPSRRVTRTLRHRPAGRHGAPHRAAQRPARPHRGDPGDAQRLVRHLGRRRLPRRDAGRSPAPRTSWSTCSSRAPEAHRAGHLRARSRRSAARPTPSPRRNTPATTRGCSTRTCRWRSTSCATWSPTRCWTGRRGDRARRDPRRDRHARRRARRRGARPLRRGRLRRPPARPADLRHRGDHLADDPAADPDASTARRYTRADDRHRRGRQPRPRHGRPPAGPPGAARHPAGTTRAPARSRRAPRPATPGAVPRTAAVACCTRTPSRRTSSSAAPGIGRLDERRFALGVLNNVLGGGMSSRLFQEIREQRGLAYSVYSYTIAVRRQRASSASTPAARRARSTRCST